jgi:hypothetical protein
MGSLNEKRVILSAAKNLPVRGQKKKAADLTLALS